MRDLPRLTPQSRIARSLSSGRALRGPGGSIQATNYPGERQAAFPDISVGLHPALQARRMGGATAPP